MSVNWPLNYNQVVHVTSIYKCYICVLKWGNKYHTVGTIINYIGGRRGHDFMIVGCTTSYAISAYRD
jgi:hypothetical protein